MAINIILGKLKNLDILRNTIKIYYKRLLLVKLKRLWRAVNGGCFSSVVMVTILVIGWLFSKYACDVFDRTSDVNVILN
jgi:hypothetical protein